MDLSTTAQYRSSQGNSSVNITLGHLAYAGLCLVFLASPLIFYIVSKTFNLITECTGDIDGCINLPSSKKFATATWAAVFSLAGTAGCLGTIISFLLRETTYNKDDSNSLLSNNAFIARQAIIILSFFGTTFGLIMLALFVGGFVEGSLFPSSLGASWVKINVRVQDWAKIFVWCFLAGFSERLIPELLNSLVRRVEPKPDQEKHYVTNTADNDKKA